MTVCTGHYGIPCRQGQTSMLSLGTIYPPALSTGLSHKWWIETPHFAHSFYRSEYVYGHPCIHDYYTCIVHVYWVSQAVRLIGCASLHKVFSSCHFSSEVPEPVAVKNSYLVIFYQNYSSHWHSKIRLIFEAGESKESGGMKIVAHLCVPRIFNADFTKKRPFLCPRFELSHSPLFRPLVFSESVFSISGIRFL